MNNLDIFSLALVMILIIFCAQSGSSLQLFHLPGWTPHPDSFAPICLFLLLFSLKDISGHLVLQSQNQFVYPVAFRISRASLFYNLERGYAGFVKTDSSVPIRKISQRQRIALTRALYKEGNLVVLDEPFSELDQKGGTRWADLFFESLTEKEVNQYD